MVQTQGFQLIANRVVNFRFATTADQVVNLRFATRVHVTNNNKSCKCCVKCVKNPGLQRLQVYNAPGLQFANATRFTLSKPGWMQINYGRVSFEIYNDVNPVLATRFVML